MNTPCLPMLVDENQVGVQEKSWNFVNRFTRNSCQKKSVFTLKTMNKIGFVCTQENMFTAKVALDNFFATNEPSNPENSLCEPCR